MVQDAIASTPAIDQDFALVTSGNLARPGVGLILLDRPSYTAPGVMQLEVLDPATLPEYLAADPTRVVILPAARYASHPEWQRAAPRVLASHFVTDRDYLLVTRAEP